MSYFKTKTVNKKAKPTNDDMPRPERRSEQEPDEDDIDGYTGRTDALPWEAGDYALELLTFERINGYNGLFYRALTRCLESTNAAVGEGKEYTLIWKAAQPGDDKASGGEGYIRRKNVEQLNAFLHCIGQVPNNEKVAHVLQQLLQTQKKEGDVKSLEVKFAVAARNRTTTKGKDVTHHTYSLLE